MRFKSVQGQRQPPDRDRHVPLFSRIRPVLPPIQGHSAAPPAAPPVSQEYEAWERWEGHGADDADITPLQHGADGSDGSDITLQYAETEYGPWVDAMPAPDRYVRYPEINWARAVLSGSTSGRLITSQPFRIEFNGEIS